jgi:hypothetical protein
LQQTAIVRSFLSLEIFLLLEREVPGMEFSIHLLLSPATLGVHPFFVKHPALARAGVRLQQKPGKPKALMKHPDGKVTDVHCKRTPALNCF